MLVTILGAASSWAEVPVDRVPHLVDIESLSGEVGGPAIATSTWIQLRHELVHAAGPGGLGWPDAETIIAAGRGGVSMTAGEARHRVPIGVIDAQVTRGGADGARSQRVLAAAPLLPVTHRGESVMFRIPRAGILGHDAHRIVSLALDLDDGRGWRPVAVDTDLPARYAVAGLRTLRLRVATADGAVGETRFHFDVRSPGLPVPDDTLSITGAPYLGASATGEAYVYLAPGHDAVVDPVVVVEGFDLDNSLHWDELYVLLNQENLLEDLRTRGFDAVVLNFADATDYLQRNGQVVRSLVEEVSGLVPGTPVALVGASMGGLLSRYALADLEHEGVPHPVDRYISFDAPHAGANIPLGIQYWVAFFADESAEAAALLASLDSPAARQLLVYHRTDPPGTTGVPDPLRATFLAELADLGGFPSGPRSAAVANGSGVGLSQGFGGGDRVVEWEYRGFLVDIDGDVYAVPDGGSALIFDGRIDVIGLPADVQQVTVTGTLPYDHAPGGYRSSMAQMDAVEAPFGDIVALHPAHAFVPTVSALDLSGVGLFHDLSGDPDLLTRSPFDALYFPLANQDHVTITPESAAWFLAEIDGAVVSAGATAPPSPTWLTVAPNPFRGATAVGVTLAQAGPLRARVFDPTGREVARLADGWWGAGTHRLRWDGRDRAGRPVSPGLYLVESTTAAGVESRKVVIGP
jgi:hypothetical protein